MKETFVLRGESWGLCRGGGSGGGMGLLRPLAGLSPQGGGGGGRKTSVRKGESWLICCALLSG